VRPSRALIASFPPADGALNFARDDALLAMARESGDLFARVYSWSEPTISFGRNERTAGWYSPQKLAQADLKAVRRRTGGRALLHSREVTYAIAGRADASDTVTSTYMELSDILLTALRALRIPAEISAGTRKENTEGAPCFATVTRGEIVVNGRKLVASAQWRGDGAFLQHGSIMISDHQRLLERALEDGRTLELGDTATLEELMPAPFPTGEEFADALANAFDSRTGVAVERVAPSTLLDEDIVRNRIEHYLDPAWTWRR
jgi:lipoyl(octanoyl) transferase